MELTARNVDHHLTVTLSRLYPTVLENRSVGEKIDSSASQFIIGATIYFRKSWLPQAKIVRCPYLVQPSSKLHNSKAAFPNLW